MNSTENPETMTEQHWVSAKILVPAILTNHLTGESVRTDINLIDYMGPTSKYGQHKGNTLNPFMAEHWKPHVFPDLKDDSKASIAIITQHLVQMCAQDGFGLVYHQYHHQQLVYKCKRRFLSKGKLPSSRKKRPTEKQYRCQLRLPFAFSHHEWHFSAGSGRASHCFHEREAIKNGSKKRKKSNDESLSAEDAFLLCGEEGEPSRTHFTHGHLWNELCEICDNSNDAVTRHMEERLQQIIAECHSLRKQRRR
ncbi:hypothetical protein FisN_2Hu133 [Fistulifera solaris]|uniref:Uncharacterized protein n=1 Tax=Fistulifera solaris TaxID=1519565 RepID=A0A1Z5KQ31_FISSO|nr:hypothetical protein FisN_2Hu133 [Fistulifera solaris]|eukprot:GAX28048.1 hypothetical protein FisN_2Hu133 [Fistulifera solaris]